MSEVPSPLDWPFDAEHGMPLIGACRPLAHVVVTRDDEVTNETLVFANLIVRFDIIDGVRWGQSAICTGTAAARVFTERVLGPQVRDVNAADNHMTASWEEDYAPE